MAGEKPNAPWRAAGNMAGRALVTRFTGPLRVSMRSTTVALIVGLVTLPLGGCISATSSNLVSTQENYQPVALDVAGVETSASASQMLANDLSSPAVGDVAGESDLAASEVAIASVIPVPAPRNGADNPLLNEGTAMAFSAETAPAADSSTPMIASGEPVPATAEVAGTDPAAQPASVAMQPVQAQPAEPAKPKSLFELLFARQTKKVAEPTRVASLTPIMSAATNEQVALKPTNESSGASLPGVGDTSKIFELESSEDQEGEGEPLELASAGSLGRLSPLGIITQTEKVEVACFKPELISLLNQIERNYGRKPIVTSGYRSTGENRRAGGARKSLHVQCRAADIQIPGISKWDLAKYLRTIPNRGGVGTYCRTDSVHIDTGSVRDWHHPCRRNKKKRA
ncbi:MAG: D-Ala-D-Ala carboxypeptidase family metallohydrolase [Rhizobiaceae bacterium]